MKLLLDTHILLWWLAGDPALTPTQCMAIEDKRNSCFVSAATIWEISIKSGLGKLYVPSEYLEVLTSQGFFQLPISWAHSQAVSKLPVIHKDPFDRILIAQAQIEGMTLVCNDPLIAKYEVLVI